MPYGSKDGTSLAGLAVVGWVGNWIPWPALAAFLLLLLWFPDGQPPSPRWRPIGWAIVAYCAVVMVFLALYPGLISVPELDNPFAVGRRRHGDAHAAASWGPRWPSLCD